MLPPSTHIHELSLPRPAGADAGRFDTPDRVAWAAWACYSSCRGPAAYSVSSRESQAAQGTLTSHPARWETLSPVAQLGRMAKTCQKVDSKNSSNWLIIFMPAPVLTTFEFEVQWKTGYGNYLNLLKLPWKTRENTSRKFIFGGILLFGPTVRLWLRTVPSQSVWAA